MGKKDLILKNKQSSASPNEEKDYVVSIKNDVTFKRIVARSGNEIFLKEFLGALLKIEIYSIFILHDVYLERDSDLKKLGVLDVRAIVNNKIIVSLEMQAYNKYNTLPRSKNYGAKNIADQLSPKQEYQSLLHVVSIWLMDYVIFPFEDDYLNETVTVLKKHKDYEVDLYEKYYYIEMPKFRRSKKNLDNIVEQWLTFFSEGSEEEMLEVIKKNSNIKEAANQMKYLRGSEKFKRKAYLRDKLVRDWKSGLISARDEGKEQGIIEGKNVGIQENKIATAKNMIKMNMKVEDIVKATGLTIVEVKNIKKEI